MCKCAKIISPLAYFSRWHIWRMWHFAKSARNTAEPLVPPLQWQFYRFTHATSYTICLSFYIADMSLFWLHWLIFCFCCVVFLDVFILCFSWIFYLIIVITACVIFFSLVFSQPLNLSLIKHQWINIFKFIQNRLIFARFVCRCRYTTIASCVVTRYTR